MFKLRLKVRTDSETRERLEEIKAVLFCSVWTIVMLVGTILNQGNGKAFWMENLNFCRGRERESVCVRTLCCRCGLFLVTMHVGQTCQLTNIFVVAFVYRYHTLRCRIGAAPSLTASLVLVVAMAVLQLSVW